VATSLLLLIGATLVMRSAEAAQHADTGVDSRNVISVTLDLKPGGYDAAHGVDFYQRLLDEVRSRGNVESATLSAIYPLTMVPYPGRPVVIEGYASSKEEDLTFGSNVITPDYFKTLRIPLLAGREFERRDDAAAPEVAIVNETLARRFWGTPQNAIGKRL